MAQDYRQRIYERYLETLPLADTADDQGPLHFYARLIDTHLPDRTANIVELGAGSGSLLRLLQQRGYQRVQGVDTSAEQVARARARGVPVSQADVMDYLKGREAATLDALIAIDLVEHLTKAEILPLLDEVYRVLAPGGRVIIHTVNAASPFFGLIRYGDFTHETAFTPASISQVLRTVGFREISCFEDSPIVHGLKSSVRAGIWALARTAALIVLAAETGSFQKRVLTQNFLTVAVKTA